MLCCSAVGGWSSCLLEASWTKNQSTMSSAGSLKIKKIAACSGQVVSVGNPCTHSVSPPPLCSLVVAAAAG